MLFDYVVLGAQTPQFSCWLTFALFRQSHFPTYKQSFFFYTRQNIYYGIKTLNNPLPSYIEKGENWRVSRDSSIVANQKLF